MPKKRAAETGPLEQIRLEAPPATPTPFRSPMAPSPVDTVLAAVVFIKRYGKDAPAEVEKRAQQLFLEDDVEGAAIWTHIEAAILELLAKGHPRAMKKRGRRHSAAARLGE